MVVARWGVCGSLVLTLIGLPWLVAAWLYSADSVVWECHLDFEVLAIASDQTVERTLGSYSQFFQGDNSGFSRISGRKVNTLIDGQTRVQNFHRFVDFKYLQAGPYLKNTVAKITRKKGDTLREGEELAFISPPGEDVYMQVLRLGPNTYSFGGLGMPRQICQGRQGWLMPRLR